MTTPLGLRRSLVVMALAAGCGGAAHDDGGADGGGPDASADGGVGDAGSSDSGALDAGADAGALDAGRDGGVSAWPDVPPSTQPPVLPAAGPVVVVSLSGTYSGDAGAIAVFTSIQAAIGAVADGGTVFVTDGVYPGPVVVGPTRGRVNVIGMGSGAVIDCAQRVSGWQVVSGAIYRATPAAVVSAVFVDGGFLPRARYPTSGYATVASTDPATTRFTKLPLTASDDAVLRAHPLSNALVTLRVVDYWWNTAKVASLSGGVLNVGSPSGPLARECSNAGCDFTAPALQGWGYFLENEEWMLTRPGGWAYDATANQLSVWLPDSSDPNTTPVWAAGFSDCVTISRAPDIGLVRLTLARSGRNGVSLAASPGARLSQVSIRDVKRVGLEVSDSDPFIVDDSRISRTASDCARHWISSSATSLSTAFESNVFESCGMALAPTFTAAAVMTYPSQRTTMTLRHNLFRRSAYIGVYLARGARFEANTLIDSCLTSDDCGAIYTWGDTSNQVIRDNVVVGVAANTVGKAASRGPYPAAGIYLDDFSHHITVEDNVVADADIGVLLHNAHDTVVQRNTVLTSRAAQIRLQEDSVRQTYDPSTGTFEDVLDGGATFPSMSGNVFAANRLVDSAGSVTLLHDSDQRSSVAGLREAFGGQGNEYWSLFSRVIVRSTSGDWEFDDLSARGVDVSPWRPTPNVADAYVVSAAQSPVFGLSAANKAAFSSYAASGTVTSSAVSCPAPSTSGSCVRLQASSSATSILISPSFSIVNGQLYRISLQVRADQAQAFRVEGWLRRAGPTYESLNSLPLTLSVKASSSAWASVNFFAVASASVSPARFDLEVPRGTSLLLGELTVTPVTGVPVTTEDDVFAAVNPSFFEGSAAGCAGPCSGWREADGGLAALPWMVPPRSARVLWR